MPSSSGGASMQGWAPFSQKTLSAHQKPPEDALRHNDGKMDQVLNSKSASAKDKAGKSLKNHSKNAASKFTVSDAWAEALGAKMPKPESKMLQKPSASNSFTKHNSLPSAPRTPNSFDSISLSQKTPTHKVTHSNSHLPNKVAPYPKSSASMPTVPAKNSANKNNVQNQESAAKRLQMVKKKAAKQQQKRNRV